MKITKSYGGYNYPGDVVTGQWNITDLKRIPNYRYSVRSDGLVDIYFDTAYWQSTPTQVWAVYGQPPGTTDKILPGVLLMHGGGGTAFPAWVQAWVDRGYAAIAPDLGGLGPDGTSLDNGSTPDNQSPYKYLNINTTDPRTVWPYHAITHAAYSLSILRSQKKVNPDKLCSIGVSWGGYLNCLLVGMDDRIQGAVAHYGGGDMRDCGATWDKNIDTTQQSLWLANYDAMEFINATSASLLLTAGVKDQNFFTPNFMNVGSRASNATSVYINVYSGAIHSEGSARALLEPYRFIDAIIGSATALTAVNTVIMSGSEIRAECNGAIVHASVNFTTDTTTWSYRTWTCSEMTVTNTYAVGATIPASVTGWYIRVTDSGSYSTSTTLLPT